MELFLHSPLAGGFFFFFIGTLFGSFFNVLIHRLPKNESIIHPPSHCPFCEKRISWYDNIPLVSYLWLRGKCRNCSVHIPLRYPLVEAATGIVSLLIFVFYLRTLTVENVSFLRVVVYFVQYLSLLLIIPTTLIDLREYIIPDSFTLGGLGVSLAVSFIPGGVSFFESVLGVAAGGGTLYFFAVTGKKILGREALGGGDIKLLAWFGALWGPFIALGTIFLGALTGLCIILFLAIFKKMDMDVPVPFGPALYAGLFISLFWGELLWDAYSSLYL
ncbi:MAG: prepilin peptidase [Fibrobacterota bacterium]